MNRPILAALALTLLAAPTLAAPGLARASEAALTLRLTGLKAAEGQVVVALFDSEAAYKATRNPVRTARAAATAPITEVRWTGLPPGRYAAVAFHDRDGDGELDKLPVGLPTEPYAFSNNARGRLGAPAWKAAAFDLGAGAHVQTATLK